MEKRLRLQAELEALLGSEFVYFQPPSSKELHYPAIVYETDGFIKDFANNSVYSIKTKYSLTVIDEDPDSEVVQKVNQLPLCTFVRPFTSDNLNHYVFNIYY